MIVSNSINQMFEEMKGWRQELHSIPEIGLEEYETSKYIKSKLLEFTLLISNSKAELPTWAEPEAYPVIELITLATFQRN